MEVTSLLRSHNVVGKVAKLLRSCKVTRKLHTHYSAASHHKNGSHHLNMTAALNWKRQIRGLLQAQDPLLQVWKLATNGGFATTFEVVIFPTASTIIADVGPAFKMTAYEDLHASTMAKTGCNVNLLVIVKVQHFERPVTIVHDDGGGCCRGPM